MESIRDKVMKVCPRCKEEKSLNEFGKNKSRKDGLQVYCKECYREYLRQYKRTERYREYNREWTSKYHQAAKRQAWEREYRQGEKRKAALKKYDSSEKGRTTKQRSYKKITKEQRAARRAVDKALAEGILTRPAPCKECNAMCKPLAHRNKGYEKRHRLDIVFLCGQCHHLAHREA